MGFFFSYTFLSAVGFRGAAVANDCDATHAGALGTHANSHTGNPHCDGNGQHPADAATPLEGVRAHMVRESAHMLDERDRQTWHFATKVRERTIAAR